MKNWIQEKVGQMDIFYDVDFGVKKFERNNKKDKKSFPLENVLWTPTAWFILKTYEHWYKRNCKNVSSKLEFWYYWFTLNKISYYSSLKFVLSMLSYRGKTRNIYFVITLRNRL